MLNRRFSSIMDDGSTIAGSVETSVGPTSTVRANTNDDHEMLAELARLRARLGFAQDAPRRVIAQRYEVEEVVGRGAMGSVYRARDTKLPRHVALKVVRPRPFSDPTALRQRLAREAELLARVQHPNVVTIYDVEDHLGELCLTMQYVAGRTLRAWQRESKPDMDALLDAYLQAARGLAAAHAVGVVHRDFKPENVLIGPNGAVHVVDFGIAGALRGCDSTARSRVLGSVKAASAHSGVGCSGTIARLLPLRASSPE